MDSQYEVKLPMFEGPLDLLLSLIRENKIDIYDIPIAFITNQYLQYLKMMKDFNIDVAGEFLVMAATLIYIKSRMLLPIDEQGEEEEEDPRLELVQRLIEYQSYKDAAFALKEREAEWRHFYIKEPMVEDDETSQYELSLINLSPYDLLNAFNNILKKSPTDTEQVTRETLTIKDKIAVIIERIEKKENIRFDELFVSEISRMEKIVTFLALLEVLRLGLVRAYQKGEFGSIWLQRNNNFEDDYKEMEIGNEI